MAYPIHEKLVVAVSASALFDTSTAQKIYDEQGLDQYIQWLDTHKSDVFPRGSAFPFVQKLLRINEALEKKPIEVVLLTRNPLDADAIIHNSLLFYKLPISRLAYSSGEFVYPYLPAFNACLFLSCNAEHIKEAIKAGMAAGAILPSTYSETDEDDDLKLAFDFDGVLGDDASERFYLENKKDMAAYMKHELDLATTPLKEGPLGKLVRQLSIIERMEIEKQRVDKSYRRMLKTYIVTARNVPADERLLRTIKDLEIVVDGAFFLGGIEKSRVLNILQPQLFFDDQTSNFSNLSNVIAVHVPYGINNVDGAEGTMSMGEMPPTADVTAQPASQQEGTPEPQDLEGQEPCHEAQTGVQYGDGTIQ